MIVPTADAVRRYVKAHPGSTCAKIAASIDAPTVVVSRLLRALLADGKVSKEGNTKATQWSYANARKTSPARL